MFQFGAIQVLGMALDGKWSRGQPLSAGWVPLQRGVNVLYGLNGAGKSLILEALTAALTGKTDSRDGVRLEVIVQLADGVFKGDSDDDDWDEFIYVREDIAHFLKRFEQPGEYMLDSFDHLDADGTAWVFMGDLLDRLENSLASSIAASAYLPEGVEPSDVAGELVRQRIFSVTSADPNLLQVRGMPDESSPLLTRVTDWRENASKEDGNHNDSSIESIWPSAPNELRCQLPPLYEWCYQDWIIGSLGIPVSGLPSFEPNKATAHTLNEIARSWPTDLRSDAHSHEQSIDARAHDTNVIPLRRNYRETAKLFSGQPWITLTDDGTIATTSAVALVTAALCAAANLFYAKLLMDAPVLEADLGSPSSWLAGGGLRWGARRSETSPWVPIESLSQAERRWATLAIELALQVEPNGFLVLDEPEQALHRSAEAYMARGLETLTVEFNLCAVVATHSTEILNLVEANIHLVRRSDQGLVDHRQVHPLKAVDRSDLQDFGLLPSDLLRRQRGLLLVEGEHDLIVWDTLLGEQLNELRIELIPIRGAGKLKATLDSRVLYDFTDAHLFVLLDALDSEVVTAIWQEACRIAKTQNAQAAAEYADLELKRLKVDEANSLASWASRALALGRESRHTPLTLEAADVLEYLPVNAFVPGSRSWKDLRDECARSQGGVKPSGTQFKTWLRKAKGVDLGPAAVRLAAESMDGIPMEFTAHLQTMRNTLSLD